jgi:hypothetical protein
MPANYIQKKKLITIELSAGAATHNYICTYYLMAKHRQIIFATETKYFNKNHQHEN